MLFSLLILIPSILSLRLHSEFIDGNSTSTERLTHSQHGKLPLEAIEESTEEIRRKTSTETSSTERSGARSNETSSSKSSAPRTTGSDIDSSSFRSDAQTDLIRHDRSDTYTTFFGAACRNDAHCEDDELRCVANRCRPTIDTFLSKLGHQGKCGPKTMENVDSTTTVTAAPTSSSTAAPSIPNPEASNVGGKISRGGDNKFIFDFSRANFVTGGGGGSPDIHVVKKD